jgi:hypothetical protein
MKPVKKIVCGVDSDVWPIAYNLEPTFSWGPNMQVVRCKDGNHLGLITTMSQIRNAHFVGTWHPPSMLYQDPDNASR